MRGTRIEVRDKREVDIQADALGQTFLQCIAGVLFNIGAKRFEVGIGAVVAKRESHRGNVLHAAFHHYAHGSAIVAINRAIVAMIDASDDNVGPAVDNLGKCQLDAVNGCAV